MPRRIHIFGASGSGTTTLAAALAAKHGHRHLDTDDFYWFGTDPPFRHVRPVGERLALLRRALADSPSWVLSGSLCGWGDPFIPEFDLVVFLVVPTEVRLARLRAREEAWLATLPGATLRLEGDRPVAQHLARVEAAVEAGLLAAGDDRSPR
jgi:adenylate kinase family enzyme